MRNLAMLALLILAANSFAFSIDSYYTHAAVQPDGGLEVYENINFTLEKAYSEGFRSIRKEDFGGLDDIVVRSVKVNGDSVPFTKQMNGGKAEIVWKKTYAGKNVVELDYTLAGRAVLYDDFAKICFEHYGAGWSVPAGSFRSEMELPEAARGRDMHFEIYSAKKGEARIDDLTVVVEMVGVPPGNYVGGCYLYDKGALQTQNRMNGSALEMLKDERKAYGSEAIIAPEERGSSTLCCLPVAIIAAAISGFLFIKDRGRRMLPESILPPDKEEPAFVSVLVRNKLEDSDAMAAAILDLINRNCLDIVELEKKGEASATIKREHTILMLRRMPKDPKPYEAALMEMLFPGGRKEVDLDAMAEQYKAVGDKAGATKEPVTKGIEAFNDGIKKVLTDRKVWDLRNTAASKTAMLVSFGIFGLIVLCGMIMVGTDYMLGYASEGNWLEVAGTGLAIAMFLPSLAYLIARHLRPKVPEGLREEYEKWDAFARAVKSSRLKEYPPSSAVIWGGILVYATALGMAGKVKAHMSELDSLTVKRLEGMESVRGSCRNYYAAAWGLRNLSKYGNRYGPSSSHGGFSSHSSGGWSSGGGGGFGGHSSGGGGFR